MSIPLSIDKLRLARCFVQGLVVIPAHALVGFVLSWSEPHLALVLGPKCVSFPGFFFKPLALVLRPGYVF